MPPRQLFKSDHEEKWSPIEKLSPTEIWKNGHLKEKLFPTEKWSSKEEWSPKEE